MSPRRFKVSKGRAFVGSVLGAELGEYSSEELEAMVKDMEDFHAEEEAATGNEEAPDVQGPKE